jgi:uncharacterized membrane protein
MSELMVIGYDDPTVAENAYQAVQNLQQADVVDLNGLAVVAVDADGRTHVDTPSGIAGASAESGALWGTVFGILFLVPGLGLPAGAATGGLLGRLGRSGVDEEFRTQVKVMLRPGTAAVVIMASKITEDRFAAALRPYGGTVLKTSLDDEDERDLAEHLAGATR